MPNGNCKLCASVRPDYQKRQPLTALQQLKVQRSEASLFGATAARSRLSTDSGRYRKWLWASPTGDMLVQPADMHFYSIKKGGKGMLVIG